MRAARRRAQKTLSYSPPLVPVPPDLILSREGPWIEKGR